MKPGDKVKVKRTKCKEFCRKYRQHKFNGEYQYLEWIIIAVKNDKIGIVTVVHPSTITILFDSDNITFYKEDVELA